MIESNWIEQLDRDGFAILQDAVIRSACAELISSLGSSIDPDDSRRRGGRRNLFQDIPEVAQLARSEAVRGPVDRVLGQNCFATRALFFDKTPEANWKVIWHQDVTIVVRRRRDVEGFGPWSSKAGIHHVQPPAEVLERMLTVRLHLDPCGEDNGPLRVLPGTHDQSVIDRSTIDRLRAERPEHICIADQGSLLLMRPLLLHASSPAQTPGHRRVLHLEFANEELPGGLEWFERV